MRTEHGILRKTERFNIMHKNRIIQPRKTASILIPTHSANRFMLIHTCYGGGKWNEFTLVDHYNEAQSAFDMGRPHLSWTLLTSCCWISGERDWVWAAERIAVFGPVAVLVEDHRSDRSRPLDPWCTVTWQMPVIHNKHHTWPSLHRE